MSKPRVFCIAPLPTGQRCGREMVFKGEKWQGTVERAHTFQCPFCESVRVLTDSFIKSRL